MFNFSSTKKLASIHYFSIHLKRGKQTFSKAQSSSGLTFMVIITDLIKCPALGYKIHSKDLKRMFFFVFFTRSNSKVKSNSVEGQFIILFYFP